MAKEDSLETRNERVVPSCRVSIILFALSGSSFKSYCIVRLVVRKSSQMKQNAVDFVRVVRVFVAAVLDRILVVVVGGGGRVEGFGRLSNE